MLLAILVNIVSGHGLTPFGRQTVIYTTALMYRQLEPYEQTSVKSEPKYEHFLLKNAFAIMMTSSNGNISALLANCADNSPVTGEFPAQRPVTRSFDVFFDLDLNKRLSTQWWACWLETPLCPLWRHCYDCGHFARASRCYGMNILNGTNANAHCMGAVPLQNMSTLSTGCQQRNKTQ